MKPCVAHVKPQWVEPIVQMLQTDHLFYQMAAAQHMTIDHLDTRFVDFSNSTYIMEPCVAHVKPLCVEPIVQMLRTDQLLHGGSTRFSSMVDGSSPSWWIHFHQMAAATHGHLESCCIILAVTALMSVISTSLIRQFYKIGRLSLLFSKNKKTFKVWAKYESKHAVNWMGQLLPSSIWAFSAWSTTILDPVRPATCIQELDYLASGIQPKWYSSLWRACNLPLVFGRLPSPLTWERVPIILSTASFAVCVISMT